MLLLAAFGIPIISIIHIKSLIRVSTYNIFTVCVLGAQGIALANFFFFVVSAVLLLFWTLLCKGVLCNHPCLSACPSVGHAWSMGFSVVFFIVFFSDFCMKLGQHKGTNLTEPDF